MNNHYDILQIARDASQHDIKVAFRKLATKYHPDNNIGNKLAEEKFKKICEAYSCLSDPTKRSEYDKTLPKEHKDPNINRASYFGSQTKNKPEQKTSKDYFNEESLDKWINNIMTKYYKGEYNTTDDITKLNFIKEILDSEYNRFNNDKKMEKKFK